MCARSRLPKAALKFCERNICNHTVFYYGRIRQRRDRRAAQVEVAAVAGGGDIYTGNRAKTVFVTSTNYNGNLGGVAGADAKCAAAASNWDGTFLAWISTTNASDDPESRFPHGDDRYILITGTKIADDWADLTDGTLDATIDRDEFAATVDPTAVWTGTKPNGMGNASYCLDWTSSAANEYGRLRTRGSNEFPVVRERIVKLRQPGQTLLFPDYRRRRVKEPKLRKL